MHSINWLKLFFNKDTTSITLMNVIEVVITNDMIVPSEFDLIIMTKTNIKGLYKMVGSVTSKIVRNSQISVNFPYAELKNYGNAYYGKNYPLLRVVKTIYDPCNIFTFQQSIKPLIM